MVVTWYTPSRVLERGGSERVIAEDGVLSNIQDVVGVKRGGKERERERERKRVREREREKEKGSLQRMVSYPTYMMW